MSASGTSAEITAMLNRQLPRPLSRKTILTCLTRLEAKGLVKHRREGRAFRFLPTMTEAETSAWHIGNQMSEIMDRYGDLGVTVFAERVCEDPNRRALVRQLLEAIDEGSGP